MMHLFQLTEKCARLLSNYSVQEIYMNVIAAIPNSQIDGAAELLISQEI